MSSPFDPAQYKRQIEQEAYAAYERLSGIALARAADGSFRGQGHNDALDAFRHAYTSGRVTQISGVQAVAQYFGDSNEIGNKHPNDPYEHRMDLWNNEIGRRLGAGTPDKDALARAAYAATRNGGLVTSLADSRLQQIDATDPRLKRPQGDPERELLTRQDVNRINRQSRFPANHRDADMFNKLRSALPASVDDAKVAQVMADAHKAGMRNAADFDCTTIANGNIIVVGNTIGFRSVTNATDPAPPINQSLRTIDYQDAQQQATVQQHLPQHPAVPSPRY